MQRGSQRLVTIERSGELWGLGPFRISKCHFLVVYFQGDKKGMGMGMGMGIKMGMGSVGPRRE